MRADGLILVTGGTGGLGRRVVPRLREAGREVRVLSRRTHDSTDGIEYVLCVWGQEKSRRHTRGRSER